MTNSLLQKKMPNFVRAFLASTLGFASLQANALVELNSVVQIAAGPYHACALTSGGDVFCWGSNAAGQLGDGTTTDRHIATHVTGLTGVIAISAGGTDDDASDGAEPAATHSHTCALTSGGAVKCWGANSHGELGTGDTTPHSSPADVSGLASGVIAISAGGTHTCAIVSGGGVKCWGSNGSGELGDGTNAEQLTPVDVSGLSSGVASVAAAYLHTCASTSAGAMLCWGADESGQLGDGANTDQNTPVFVQGLSSGVASIGTGRGAAPSTGTGAVITHDGGDSCAVTTAGGAKCWGANATSQVGDGTTTPHSTPFDVNGFTSGVAAISVGIDRDCAFGLSNDHAHSHACALTTAGHASCWGSNAFGQLGVQPATACEVRSSPAAVASLSDTLTQLAAGAGYTCALTSAGVVKCWGYGGHGELGNDMAGLDGNNSRSAPAAVLTTASGLTPQAITFGAVPSIAVGASGTLSATGGDSGNPVVLSSLTPAACSVTGNTVNGLSNAICTIEADQSGNAAYEPGQATISFRIGDAVAQAITFGPAPTVILGNTGKLSATASSGLAVTFTSNTPSICSVSGNTVTGISPGTCTIAASQAGDALYAPAPQVTQNIAVTAASASVANVSVTQSATPS
ncbi:MAG TPA: hypothetical protein VFJ86_09745, partial [Usitatibacter sp.]|nr:hypothetical protein [Usitatibacter sp.]